MRHCRGPARQTLFLWDARKETLSLSVWHCFCLAAAPYKPLDDLDTDFGRSAFACRQYGFYPGSQQFDE
jgi:hypothetical protein